MNYNIPTLTKSAKVNLSNKEQEILFNGMDRPSSNEIQNKIFLNLHDSIEFEYLRNPSRNGIEYNEGEWMKIADFVIDLEQTKKYQYSFSTKNRVYNWVDLNVSVWI